MATRKAQWVFENVFCSATDAIGQLANNHRRAHNLEDDETGMMTGKWILNRQLAFGRRVGSVAIWVLCIAI